jgi:Rrf2 family protein
MFNIGKATEYAILFLAQLAKSKKQEPISLKLITGRANLPYKFLSRIVLKLKKAGMVKSTKGSTGGYQLVKNPEQIKLSSIIETVEPKIWFVSCMEGKCKMEKYCTHKNVWLNLQKKLHKEMAKTTLKDLL